MTATPISDESMARSEPHGYEVVPYYVAMALEIENAALRKKLAMFEPYLNTPTNPPGEPKEVYSPHTKMADV